MRDATLPVILIVVGGAWLLKALNWMPATYWLWTFGLAGAGIAILVLDGITKSSIIAGPMLILAGLLSFCRQHYGWGWSLILPGMLMAAGILMLVARAPSIPESRRFRRDDDRDAGERDRHG